jgi:hypothetical protein
VRKNRWSQRFTRFVSSELPDRRHQLLGWMWITLTIPSVLWWKESIIWVILLSLYANAESSFAAHQAKKSNQE